ncbi:MAG: hypothetical protein LBR80_12260, partial [Deltaproteobacteria bacterium]|nr:hypothetical protein [Deltaproteobacteria bacterium]
MQGADRLMIRAARLTPSRMWGTSMAPMPRVATAGALPASRMPPSWVWSMMARTVGGRPPPLSRKMGIMWVLDSLPSRH